MSLPAYTTAHNGTAADALSDIAYEREPETLPVPMATYQMWKEKPQPPRPTPPARCTIGWTDDGVSFLYTVEADSNAACFAMIKEVKAAIAKSRQQSTQAQPPVETTQQTAPSANVQPEASQAVTAAPASCPLHGERYLKPSKFGGSYCATKLGDESWCKYKTKGGAA